MHRPYGLRMPSSLMAELTSMLRRILSNMERSTVVSYSKILATDRISLMSASE